MRVTQTVFILATLLAILTAGAFALAAGEFKLAGTTDWWKELAVAVFFSFVAGAMSFLALHQSKKPETPKGPVLHDLHRGQCQTYRDQV